MIRSWAKFRANWGHMFFLKCTADQVLVFDWIKNLLNNKFFLECIQMFFIALVLCILRLFKLKKKQRVKRYTEKTSLQSYKTQIKFSLICALKGSAFRLGQIYILTIRNSWPALNSLLCKQTVRHISHCILPSMHHSLGEGALMSYSSKFCSRYYILSAFKLPVQVVWKVVENAIHWIKSLSTR